MWKRRWGAEKKEKKERWMSMIWYMMPADQEKTSTPHLDLTMRMIMVVKMKSILTW